jgi:hypothetical protein
MHNEIEETIQKLTELSIKKRDFIIEYINEAHRQEKEVKESANKDKALCRKRISFAPKDRVSFQAEWGTIYKDSIGKVLHRGDRVIIETKGNVRGIKINKGDLGYLVGSEAKSGYAIVIPDKLIGRIQETTKRLPQNLTIIEDV